MFKRDSSSISVRYLKREQHRDQHQDCFITKIYAVLRVFSVQDYDFSGLKSRTRLRWRSRLITSSIDIKRKRILYMCKQQEPWVSRLRRVAGVWSAYFNKGAERISENYYPSGGRARGAPRLQQLYCAVVQTRQNVIELKRERPCSVMWKIITRSGWYLRFHAPLAGVSGAPNGNPANDNLFSAPLILN
ncbi:hypothetical protein EVAR_88649_1 [Eumeta japonica]|uniref:Uncharacterized protein n=1 Tax=Eumeta variegata TaxID=151549 RepID=A0A4C1YBG0_EUMVA|nr:hypothetical protein EVAR_88649_1 [Eumeta japonica]